MTLQLRRLDGASRRASDVLGWCGVGRVKPSASLSVSVWPCVWPRWKAAADPSSDKLFTGHQVLQPNKSGGKGRGDAGVSGRMFTGFGGGELFRRKVPFRHSRLSWPSARSDRSAAVCESLPLHVENISCGGRSTPSPTKTHAHTHTLTEGVAFIFAKRCRHFHSDTSVEKQFFGAVEQSPSHSDISTKVPLGGLLLTGRLCRLNQALACPKMILNQQERRASDGYAGTEAKTIMRTQVPLTG